jgi:hypothetical protein
MKGPRRRSGFHLSGNPTYQDLASVTGIKLLKIDANNRERIKSIFIVFISNWAQARVPIRKLFQAQADAPRATGLKPTLESAEARLPLDG